LVDYRVKIDDSVENFDKAALIVVLASIAACTELMDALGTVPAILRIGFEAQNLSYSLLLPINW
jgi:hypothetical protein